MSMSNIGYDTSTRLDRTLDTLRQGGDRTGEVGRNANQGVFEGRTVALNPSVDEPGGRQIRNESQDRLSQWMPGLRREGERGPFGIGVDRARPPVPENPPDPPPPPPSRHSPPLQEQVNKRLMTFEQLVDRMDGHRPKKDVTLGPFVLHRNSVAFKEVQNALELYHFTLNEVTLGEVRDTGPLLNALRGELNEAEAGARRYLQKHEGNPNRAVQCEAMRAVLDQIDAERQLLDEVENDPEFDRLTDSMTFGQALQIRRCGVNLEDCDFDTFTDARIDHDGSDERFGFGVNNSVAKLTYGNDPPRIFKPEQVGVHSTVGAMVGIDPETPHSGNRNIATRVIDEALGTRLIPDSRFVFHNNQLGLLMEKAPGQSPMKREVLGEVPEHDLSEMERELIRSVRDDSDPNNPWDTTWARELGTIGLSLEVDRNGREIWTRSRIVEHNPFTAFPDGLPSPMAGSLHKQLMGLQWNDAITGQVDRHAQNYLIDVDPNTQTVTVTGIDNDVAFAPGQDRVPRHQDNFTNFHATGLPPLIDRAMRDRIEGMDFDCDVAPRLRGLLTTQELNSTRQRFDEARQHALSLPESRIVDDWETWRSPDGQTVSEFLQAQPPESSLFARDLARHLPNHD